MVPTEIVTAIRREGGARIPKFLSHSELAALLTELKTTEFIQQPLVHGAFSVQQSFSSTTHFVAGGHVVRTYCSVESHINAWFGNMAPSPLCKPFRCTDVVVQRYPPGPMGISPHRDGAKFINLIAIVVLEGHGRFAFCDDRAGANARRVTHEPGDLLLMRGVGFDGSDYQPFHFVDQIASQRTTLGVRQVGTCS